VTVFKFPLQRVLELRARKERDAATALVSAEDAAEEARAARAALEMARLELAERHAPPGGAAAPSVGELRNLGYLLERLDERVAVAASASAAAEAAVDQRRDELRLAHQDRRALDRLRERQHDDWRTAEATADRQLMDEIALTRFTQHTQATQDES
jgi:flagellar FliJ protein